jgi:hypothetical protein
MADETITFNLDELTLGELADLEDVLGTSLKTINLSNPPVKLLVAMTWLITRRSNPKFTYEDARNVKISNVAEVKDTLKKIFGGAAQ